MTGLDKYAEQMIDIKVDNDMLQNALKKVFKVKEEATAREKANTDKLMGNYMVCYAAPDIAQFAGTAWGALNAMTDMVAHATPNRATKNYQENNWGRIMNGHKLVDEMAEIFARA